MGFTKIHKIAAFSCVLGGWLPSPARLGIKIRILIEMHKHRPVLTLHKIQSGPVSYKAGSTDIRFQRKAVRESKVR